LVAAGAHATCRENAFAELAGGLEKFTGDRTKSEQNNCSIILLRALRAPSEQLAKRFDVRCSKQTAAATISQRM
jgi:hypothetical protein